MEFTKEMIDAVDRLSALDALIDFKTIWTFIRDSGLMNSICYVSLAFTFFTTVAAILRKFFQTGAEFRPGLYISEIVKMIFIAMFFNIPRIYTAWIGLLSGLMTKIYQGLGSDALFAYQVQFRSFLYGVQSVTETAGSAKIQSAGILSLMLSVANNFVIAAYFAVLSIGPVVFCMAVLLGPLMLSFSILLPALARQWSAFFISSIFISSITTIALMAIADSGVLQIAADYSFGNSQIIALVMVLCAIVALTFVPMAVMQLFGVRFYGFISAVFGFVVSAFGLVPLGISMVLSSKSTNVTRKGGL